MPSEKPTFRSYTSLRLSVGARWREFVSLYHEHTRAVPEQVRTFIQRTGQVEEAVEATTGLTLRRLKMLDIGPGQKLRHMTYFARENDVVGVDLDVIPQGFDVAAYFAMLRWNGALRSTKTLGRKILGIDAVHSRELRQQLKISRIPKHKVLRGDASRLQFKDESFDFVYSFSVFQSLPDPALAVGEVCRVLRPGGAAYLSLHNFTSEHGACDPRTFGEGSSVVPPWAHLRSAHSAQSRSNAYLNKYRLGDWQALFASRMPGVQFIYRKWGVEERLPELAQLRQQGELQEYSDDELLTVDFAAVWRKPSQPL